jgi:hypothetical protein
MSVFTSSKVESLRQSLEQTLLQAKTIETVDREAVRADFLCLELEPFEVAEKNIKTSKKQ